MGINHIFNNKGQSIIEYAIIVGLVVAALSAMQVYMRRGIQAGIKVAADELGPQDYAEKIDPQKGTTRKSDVNTKTSSTQRVRLFKGGSQRININKTTTSSGTSEYEYIAEER